ncbi:hypothetical protein P5V15_011804 [Pogonomyrmex californicus]
MLSFIILVVGVLAQQTFADEPDAIVGGQRASPGQFPHQCSLRYNGQHVCGCSIIGPDKILTACHCVKGIASPPYNNYKVATGTISISGGQIHNVQSATCHPNYMEGVQYAWANDVAVIRLKQPMTFNQYQSPIKLAQSQPAPGTRCTLSGWGLTRANGSPSPTLLFMNQNALALSECQSYHRGMPLGSSHLCMLDKRGVGACQGDSGGPLICNGVQCGITSWVAPCAQGVPDAYSNVPNNLGFINSH